jgi:RNA-directed DNA polymerase
VNAICEHRRGWARYHRHVVAKDTFRLMDHHVWRALWRWAKRRHSGKGSDWIRRKYYRALGNRSWVFAAHTDQRSAEGVPAVAVLRSASAVRIERHLQVRADANPFDPAWQPYFTARKAAKGRADVRVVPRYRFISKATPPRHPDSHVASPAPSRGR